MNKKHTTIFFLIMFLLFHKSFAQSCSGITTSDLEFCRYNHLKTSEKILDRYIAAASNRLIQNGKTQTINTFNSSQRNWSLYRDQECSSVRSFFEPGSIAGLMKIDCQQRLTDVRTHEIWSSWLRYMDNTPSILPEPHP